MEWWDSLMEWWDFSAMLGFMSIQEKLMKIKKKKLKGLFIQEEEWIASLTHNLECN